MSEQAIHAEGITKSFKQLAVLKGVDLSIKKGSVFALLGPNGAGKTTMVRILSTLLTPDSGTAMVNGFDVVKQPNQVRSSIGLTGQYAAVDETLNARENLKMMGRLYRLNGQDIGRRTEELLEQFDLVDAANRSVKTFSGGMRRRLDLALSLIATPPIVYLDEPTTGLDPRSRLVVWDMITNLVKDGATVLLTTQYLEEADQLANQIAVIDNGVIIAQGTSDELKSMAGKERLELTFTTDAQLEKAKQLLSKNDLHIEGRKLSLPNEGGVPELRNLLKDLDENNVEPESLSVHKPTLDDVFLKLTGHQAETKEEQS